MRAAFKRNRENVIFTQARVVKVLDFGIAKFNGQGLQSTGRLRGVLGTPSYMSPEQILGDAVTFASDVYQIGVMIYEMVAGRHPFSNRRGELPTQTQMCEFHVELTPRPLTELGVPEDVWAVKARGPGQRTERAMAHGGGVRAGAVVGPRAAASVAVGAGVAARLPEPRRGRRRAAGSRGAPRVSPRVDARAMAVACSCRAARAPMATAA